MTDETTTTTRSDPNPVYDYAHEMWCHVTGTDAAFAMMRKPPVRVSRESVARAIGVSGLSLHRIEKANRGGNSYRTFRLYANKLNEYVLKILGDKSPIRISDTPTKTEKKKVAAKKNMSKKVTRRK